MSQSIEQKAAEKANEAYPPMAIGGTDNIYVTGKKKGAFAKGYISGYEDAMKWVSVEDEMPKEGEMVLTCNWNKYISSSFWSTIGHMNEKWFRTNFTHWMPLPQPPKQ